MKNRFYISLLSFGLLALVSCKEEDATPSNELQIPSTYTFENSSFSGQITRLNMLSELVAYIETANTGEVLDSIKLINMFNGSDFNEDALNASGKKLSDKTASFLKSTIETYLKEAAATSELDREAKKDTSGISNSTGLKPRMVNANGIEYSEFIEKGIMAATFMDQALNNYLAEFELDDNTSASFVEGEGTAMAHHWDEAYGYFTDSKNFPSEGIDRFWSDYSNRVTPITNSNSTLLCAFITGRAAINAGKIDIAKEQRDIIKTEWTKLAAAMAIRYINSSKANFNETTSKIHTLSEAYGFILAVKVGGGNVNDLIDTIENSNLYDLTEIQLTDISNSLATQFDLKTVQSSL